MITSYINDAQWIHVATLTLLGTSSIPDSLSYHHHHQPQYHPLTIEKLEAVQQLQQRRYLHLLTSPLPDKAPKRQTWLPVSERSDSKIPRRADKMPIVVIQNHLAADHRQVILIVVSKR